MVLTVWIETKTDHSLRSVAVEAGLCRPVPTTLPVVVIRNGIRVSGCSLLAGGNVDGHGNDEERRDSDAERMRDARLGHSSADEWHEYLYWDGVNTRC